MDSTRSNPSRPIGTMATKGTAGEWPAGRDELEVLILAQLVEEERFATLFDRLSDIECGSYIAIQREDRRSRRQHDCAGVGMLEARTPAPWEELAADQAGKS